MASEPLRGALVGFGRVAEIAHVPAFAKNPRLKLVAVAEADSERRKAAAAALPDAKVYASLDELLAAEAGLGFAVVATPPAAHGAQVLAALKAGCHVLCEKPLTLDVEEYEAVKRRAAASELSAFTVHNWAHSPQWKRLLALLDEGAVGELRHVELHALRSSPAAAAGGWRTDAAVAGGGVLIDHGWHNFYLLNRVLPSTPSRVTGRLGAGDAAAGVEDDATVFLEYPKATALIHLSWRSALRSNTGLFFGSKGLLELHDGRLALRGADGSEKSWDFPEKLSAASAHPDWTAELVGEFAAAMSDAKLRARNLDEAGFCLKMINRVYVSVRLGRNPIREALSRPRGRP